MRRGAGAREFGLDPRKAHGQIAPPPGYSTHRAGSPFMTQREVELMVSGSP